MHSVRWAPNGAESLAWRLPVHADPTQVSVMTYHNFKKIKLRSFGTDIDGHLWILEFQNGTVLDLSVNCLLEERESQFCSPCGKAVKEDRPRPKPR
jgi:hypothetical protein